MRGSVDFGSKQPRREFFGEGVKLSQKEDVAIGKKKICGAYSISGRLGTDMEI